MLTVENEKIQTLSLNQGQKAAAEGFFKFVLSDHKEMRLSGPAGTGKTYTMGEMIDSVMPEYFNTCKMMGIEPEYESVMMTATTNKAAEVLSHATKRPTETIHSFLGLRVKNDYSTGKSTLAKTQKWTCHQRMIIFVDEAFQIDSALLAYIREGTHQCKIVYVGDHCQLAPVMEPISPIQRADMPSYELKEVVRNAGQPALMKVSQQLRETVETGEFWPIQIVPGVIDHVDDDEMQKLLADTFQEQTRHARILCYTNDRVVAYNEHIRELRNLPAEYGRGELLVNNSALRMGKRMLSVEEEVEILDQQESTQEIIVAEHEGNPISLEVRYSTIKTGLGSFYNNVPIPVNRQHFDDLIKWFGHQKNWKKQYYLKETFPDFRPRDAATVHKAQGSTYDVVFIDLADISRCRQPQTAARLLYVAFTRARSRVILHGKLASKYGGLAE